MSRKYLWGRDRTRTWSEYCREWLLQEWTSFRAGTCTSGTSNPRHWAWGGSGWCSCLWVQRRSGSCGWSFHRCHRWAWSRWVLPFRRDRPDSRLWAGLFIKRYLSNFLDLVFPLDLDLLVVHGGLLLLLCWCEVGLWVWVIRCVSFNSVSENSCMVQYLGFLVY